MSTKPSPPQYEAELIDSPSASPNVLSPAANNTTPRSPATTKRSESKLSPSSNSFKSPSLSPATNVTTPASSPASSTLNNPTRQRRATEVIETTFSTGAIYEGDSNVPQPRRERLAWGVFLRALGNPGKLELNGNPRPLIWNERSSVHFVASLLARICTRPHCKPPSVLIVTANHQDAHNIEDLLAELLDRLPVGRTLKGKSMKRTKIIGPDLIKDMADEATSSAESTPVITRVSRIKSGQRHPLVYIGQADDVLACHTHSRCICICTYAIVFEVPNFEQHCEDVAWNQQSPAFLRIETAEGTGTELSVFKHRRV